MSDWVEVEGVVGRLSRKWFGDHYKEVHVAEDGDLDAAIAQVDADVASRAPVSVEAPAEVSAPEVTEVPVADVPAEAPAPADNAS